MFQESLEKRLPYLRIKFDSILLITNKIIWESLWQNCYRNCTHFNTSKWKLI